MWEESEAWYHKCHGLARIKEKKEEPEGLSVLDTVQISWHSLAPGDAAIMSRALVHCLKKHSNPNL